MSEIQRDGWHQTLPQANGNYTVTLQDSQHSVGNDFGNQFYWNIINGVVYADNDSDGFHDSNEPVLPYWTIIATGGGKTYTTTSDANGEYSLSVSEGTFSVSEILKYGWIQTQPPSHYTVTTTSFDTITGKDFGNNFNLSVITGYVFYDAWNRNGIFDSLKEWRIPGWQIQAESVDTIFFATTNSKGYYSLLLPNGIYTISAVRPSLWYQTLPLQNGTYSITLHRNDTITGKNFGFYYQPKYLYGTVFHDVNGNGIRDLPEDYGISDQVIYAYDTTENIKSWGMSWFNGWYGMDLQLGTFKIVQAPHSGWGQTFPAQNGYYTVNVQDVDSTYNGFIFGNHPTSRVQDLRIFIGSSGARPGFEYYYCLWCDNNGTTTENAIVYFTYPTKVAYTSSTPTPTGHNAGTRTLWWDLGNLRPGEEKIINIQTQIPPPPIVQIGDMLESNAYILPTAGDTLPQDNFDTCYTRVVGSFDPNDKFVTPSGIGAFGDVSPGTTLTYQIDFQNTGTDTAFNIVIQDTLDDFLDVSTFRKSAGSHPYTVFNDSGRLTFTFKNILLPDSTTNEQRSHGFVKFKIKPKQNAPLGTIIKNNASIYFDYNLPVVTNTVTNRIANIVKVSEDKLPLRYDLKNNYPNPFNPQTTIEFTLPKMSTVTLKVYNILGQEVQTLLNNKSLQEGTHEVQFDATKLSSGVYFYRININNGEYVQVKKLMLMK